MINKQLRKIKYLLIRLFRIKSNAHSIAVGFTVGSLMNFVPSFGLGPLLSAASAKLVRANTLAGFIGGLSFLWLFPLFFYLNVIIGELFIPIDVFELEESLGDTEEAIEASFQVGKAFLFGMVINLVVFGLVIYLLSYMMIRKYRSEVLQLICQKWEVSKPR
ncbi:uncharacterized protein (DUF2062 family) [Bacillus mesophilus]|uniref:DUF2062 domain-containing protein n=1 Tax=Bacillus mesophilus TaxID=1808955 RepID=A0A6M0QD22_9BACI|nr:DUF2062 domain-containing protein [Bacillus mesophilus]MBM7662395.1 uncharacterized protein (DUF2062 family) [Bacillus mesophilus]NEY72978.1 DUF2062 domain-containing protein [Bacillus mesophilus]